MAPYQRGDAVWHSAPFRDGGRPYVVLSDDQHPYHGEEYMVVGVTTDEREQAVALTPARWAEGSAETEFGVTVVRADCQTRDHH